MWDFLYKATPLLLGPLFIFLGYKALISKEVSWRVHWGMQTHFIRGKWAVIIGFGEIIIGLAIWLLFIIIFSEIRNLNT